MQELYLALVGLFAGFLGGVGKSWLDRRSKIDDGLLARRTELYAQLWKLTGDVPLYPRRETLTHDDLRATSEALKAWYFSASGGLYLAGETQKCYLAFQEVLNRVAGRRAPETLVAESDYDEVQKAGSSLRSALTRDLRSRSAPRSF